MTSRSKPVLACLLLACLQLALTGCFFGKGDKELQSGADQLYEYGMRSLNNGNYSNAIQYLEALEARYPFSNKAKQAQLDLLYAYYRNGDRDQVIDASVQFERENLSRVTQEVSSLAQEVDGFRERIEALEAIATSDPPAGTYQSTETSPEPERRELRQRA